MMRLVLALVVLLSSSIAAQTPARGDGVKVGSRSDAGSQIVKQTWKIDTAQSTLTFSLRHLLSRARGRFTAWSGTLTIPPDNWNGAAVDVVIQVSSIDTKNETRDDHLRSDDFFDAEQYPTITYKSTSVKRQGDSITVVGNLTMKGVTKPVVLLGKLTGTTTGPKPRLDFQAQATINRMDYGVSYNRVLEGGGTTLGDEVTIEITVAAVQP